MSELKEMNSISNRQLRELKVLYEIAQAGTYATDLDVFVEQAMQLLEQTFQPALDYGIGLIEPGKELIRIFTSYQHRQDELALSIDEGVIGCVISTGFPARISDVNEVPGYQSFYPGLSSQLCVPMKTGERIIGIVLVESDCRNAFDDEDERLMLTIASQLATIIEKLRLYQEMKQDAERWSVIYQATKDISASLEPEQVFQSIYQAAQQMIPCDTFYISIVDEKDQEVRDVYVMEGDRRYPVERYPINAGLTGYVVTEDKTLHYNDFNYDQPEIEPIVVAELMTRSIIIVPLRVKGKVIGALSVQSAMPNAYSTADREMLELMASQAAVAIDNARLHAEVNRLAMIDSLTEVYNRRHFFRVATLEFSRARRYQDPLTAIMLDIDHFKKVNDLFGHAIGDQVLKSVADRSNQILRSSDIIGRYGGEEFAILLVKSDLNIGLMVAERIRNHVSQMAIDSGSRQKMVTISLGVASIDDGCLDIDDLLARADQALYAAKRDGRNRVNAFPMSPEN